jgi:hypothetical protein
MTMALDSAEWELDRVTGSAEWRPFAQDVLKFLRLLIPEPAPTCGKQDADRRCRCELPPGHAGSHREGPWQWG